MAGRLRRALLFGPGVLLALAAGLVGVAWLTSAHWLPRAVATAPNAGKTAETLARAASASGGVSDVGNIRDLRIDVGPPAASLSIRILEPGRASPRATVFVLHGIRDGKQSMLGIGKSFADAGYRSVLVDLRGHGQSTGDWLSFGAREGRDLVQVIDTLAARGELVLPIAVYGPSYGGAVALQMARQDPRVRAVVTIATFTRMKDIVPLYSARIVPSWFASRDDILRAIDRAGVLGDFDPDAADSVAAIAATKANVLLVHGRADAHIPWQHSESLHDAAPGHSRLLVVEEKNHATIMSDESVVRESLAWFDRWL